MSGVKLSIWGSIPEGRERFSDESRVGNVFHASHRSLSCASSKSIARQRGIQTEL